MSSTTLSTVQGFPSVPELLEDQKEHRRRIARKINQINQGKFNCALDVTFNSNTGATIIFDNRIGFGSVVSPGQGLNPAGALVLSYGVWCDTIGTAIASTSGSITVHHTSTTLVTPKARFFILG